MIFKTLQSRVKKELRNTIYKNQIYKQNRYNFLENLIIDWSKGPFYSSVLFLIFFLTISGLGYYLDKTFKISFLDFYSYEKIYKFTELVFNAQVTILALIFPLVIGFVSILIKDDFASKALFKIYSRYSGFGLVGYSGLLFIFLFTFLQYFLPFVSDLYSIIGFLCFILWFMFNLFLLGWFIYVTTEFISIDRRNKIILKYTTNIALIKEFERKLFSLLSVYENAKSHGLLGARLENKDIEICSVDLMNDFKYIKEKEINEEKYLYNVNFTFLSWFIKSVLKSKNTELILPTKMENFLKYKFILAKTNNEDFSWWQKICLKFSYSFSKKQPFEIDIKTILEIFLTYIKNDLKNENFRKFKNSKEELIKFFQIILSLGAFINDNKEVDNLIFLRESSFFSFSLLDEFMQELYQLNDEIVNRIDKSERYFIEFCSFYKAVYFEKDDIKIHPKIKDDLIKANANLWFGLVENSKNIDKEKFNNLCKSFIGSWDNWKYRINHYKLETWNDLKNLFQNSITHLVLTNEFLQIALKHKNEKAINSALDMINYWYTNFFYLSQNNHIIKSGILGFNIFNEFQDIEKFLEYIKPNKVSQDINLKEIYSILCKNMWIQSRVINVAYILNQKLFNIDELSKQAIKILLNGDTPFYTKDFPKVVINKPEQILETFIFNSSLIEEKFKNTFLQLFFKSFYDKNSEFIIPRRIYSTMSIEHSEDLISTFQILMIANSKSAFSLSKILFDFIYSDFFTIDNRIYLIDKLKELKNIDDKVNEILEKVFDIKNDVYDSYLNNYKNYMDEIIKTIENYNNEIIIQKPINLDIKTAIKKYCSEVFLEKNSKLPLLHFNKLEFDKTLEKKENYKYGFSLNFDKNYMFDDNKNLVMNEENMFVDRTQQTLERKIYFNFITFVKFNNMNNNAKYKIFDDLLENLLQDSRNLKEPIILMEHNFSIYIEYLTWEENRFDIKIEQNSKLANEYLVGNIPIYSIDYLPKNCCFLIEKSLFQKVIVKEFEDDIFVDLKYIENKEKPIEGKLNICFYIKIIFDENAKFFTYEFVGDEGSL